MEKRPLQRQKKKLKRLHSLEMHQKPLSLLIQTQMTQTMNKDVPQNCLKKASKASEFPDTGMGVEQERQPKKAPKPPEYSHGEQGPTVNYQRCIVTYSTEDGQEPAVKQLQKVSKM